MNFPHRAPGWSKPIHSKLFCFLVLLDQNVPEHSLIFSPPPIFQRKKSLSLAMITFLTLSSLFFVTLPFQHSLPAVPEHLLFYLGFRISFFSTHDHASISPILKELLIISSNHNASLSLPNSFKNTVLETSITSSWLTFIPLGKWYAENTKVFFFFLIYKIVLHYLLNLNDG